MMNASITKKNKKTTLPPSWGLPAPSKASSVTIGVSTLSTTTISAKPATAKPSSKTLKGFDVKTTSLLASLTKTTKPVKKTTKGKTVTTPKIVVTSKKISPAATVPSPSVSVVKASATETLPAASIKKDKSSSSTTGNLVLPENFDKLGPTIVDEQGREQSTMEFLVNRFDKVLKHDSKLTFISKGSSKTRGMDVLTSDRLDAAASTKMSWPNMDEDSDDEDDDVDLTAIAQKSWTKVVSGNGKSGKADKKPLEKVALPTVASIQHSRSVQNKTDDSTQTGEDDWTNVKGQRKHWKNRTLEDLEHVVVEDKSYDVDVYRALTRDQKQKLRLLREARRAHRRQEGSHRRRR